MLDLHITGRMLELMFRWSEARLLKFIMRVLWLFKTRTWRHNRVTASLMSPGSCSYRPGGASTRPGICSDALQSWTLRWLVTTNWTKDSLQHGALSIVIDNATIQYNAHNRTVEQWFRRLIAKYLTLNQSSNMWTIIIDSSQSRRWAVTGCDTATPCFSHAHSPASNQLKMLFTWHLRKRTAGGISPPTATSGQVVRSFTYRWHLLVYLQVSFAGCLTWPFPTESLSINQKSRTS